MDLDKIAAIKAWLGTGSINIFGMPFSGKDTQCQLLAKLLGAVTFGGGDILRNSQAVSNNLLSEMHKGMLAPTDEYVALVTPYFARPEFADKPLVLSSVGRWLGEEQLVFAAAAASDHSIKVAILLTLDKGEAVRRHLAARRARIDDGPSKITTRFNEFQTKTQPVLDIYRSKGLLVEVDGGQTVEKVTVAIVEALYNMSHEART